LYYVYNPLINATWLSGWIDPVNMIIGMVADSFNQGGLISGLQVEITAIINDINAILPEITLIQANVLDLETRISAGNLTNNQSSVMQQGENIQNFGSPTSPISAEQTVQELQSINSSIVQTSRTYILTRLSEMASQINNYIATNPITAFAIGSGSIGVGIVYGIYQNLSMDSFLNRVVEKNIRRNRYLSNEKIGELLQLNSNVLITSNLIDMAVNFYNLTLTQGYINSNVLTQQFIPSLKTNSLNLNTGQITGISTLNTNAILTSTLATVNTGNIAPPSVGNYGGIGDKIILGNGTSTIYPYSIGLENKSLWISSPSNINFYNNGSNSITITSNNELWCSNKIKENNQYLGDIYPTSNVAKNLILYDTPNVNKKRTFYCQVNNLIYPNNGNTAYYKYDLYLPSYTLSQIVPFTSDEYRIFNIRVFYGSAYFGYIKNGLPNILNYEIYMSNKAVEGANFGDEGINICAIGTPENYKLNQIMPNNLFLMRNDTNNFNYLSIVSTNIADCKVIIEDLLN